MLVILFTAVIANLNMIPSASNSIKLYDIIFKYIAPISIFYLLLQVNITSIRKAGLPMVGLFILGSIATTIGILLSWSLFSPEVDLGESGKIIAGMLTGTYTGGSVNFNAIALEYEFQKKGFLYAGTIAVDNVVTTIWIIITLILPMGLKRIHLASMSWMDWALYQVLNLQGVSGRSLFKTTQLSLVMQMVCTCLHVQSIVL